MYDLWSTIVMVVLHLSYIIRRSVVFLKEHSRHPTEQIYVTFVAFLLSKLTEKDHIIYGMKNVTYEVRTDFLRGK